MKLLALAIFSLITAGLAGCGSSTDESFGPPGTGAQSSTGSIPSSSSVSSTNSSAASSSSAASTNAQLQAALKSEIESAIASGDDQEFLDLFHLDNIDADQIDQLESLVIAHVFDETVSAITFDEADDDYEGFDVDYRYTPNLEVLGEVVLHFDNADPNLTTSSSFIYGLVDGRYRLGSSQRELMQYDGPRNQQLSYSIYGQTSPEVNQFHVTATYQVSGLTRTIDVIKDAGSFSLFMGQYINTITIDQIVGDADFYVQIYESGELIHTTPVESNGATVRYVNRREF